MNLANYILQINIYLILFYGFYVIFLKNETFFQLNRIYLLGSALLSLLIPVFYFDWVKELFFAKEIQQGWTSSYFLVQTGISATVMEENRWVLGDYLSLIYLLGATVLLFRFFYNLIRLTKILNSEVKGAFSFFWKINVDKSRPEKETVLLHEQAHAAQLHSLDILFFELLKAFNWFNPVCYFYKDSMKHLHEFIADHQVVSSGKDKKEYALLLFNESFGSPSHPLTNTFFNKSLLKRRIQMLHKPKSKKAAILKYGLSVPLFFIAMVMSSATISESKAVEKLAEKIEPQQKLKELLSSEISVQEIKSSEISEMPLTEEGNLTVKTAAQRDGDLSSISAKGVVLRLAKDTALTGKNFITDEKIMVIMDGKSVEPNAINLINNKDIKHIEVLKGDKAVEKYGEDGKNGVIIIHTKEANQLDKDSILKLSADEVVVTGYGPKAPAESIFTDVENLPQYPGGMSEFYKFLVKTIEYPAKAKEAKIQGRVTVNFIVEKDGSLTNFKVLRGVPNGEELDEEAIRVLKLSPKWKPGIQNGKEVRVSYSVPIMFQLQKSSNQQPYILVDGKETSEEEMKKIDPKTIEKIAVLKDKSATEKYGDKGKNGVVIITIKK